MEGYFRPNQATLDADANRANREGMGGYRPIETRTFDRFDNFSLFVMPPWGQDGQMRREIGWHWQCHPMKFPVPCLQHWGESCPVCDVLERAMIDFSSDDVQRKEIIRRMAKTRIYVNAIEVKMRDANPGDLPNLVQVWEFPIKVYNAVARVLHDWPDALDPAAAFVLKVTKTKPTSKDGFPDYQTSYVDGDEMVGDVYAPRLQPWVVDENGKPHEQLIGETLRSLKNLNEVYYNPGKELEEDIQRAADAVNRMFYGRAAVGSVPPVGQTPSTTTAPGGAAAPAAPAAAAPAAQASAAAVPSNGGNKSAQPQITPPTTRRYPEGVDPTKYACYGGVDGIQNEVGSIGFTPDSDACLKCPHQQPCQAELRSQRSAQA